MVPLLFFLLALFPFSTEAGEIIGGEEVIPHSRPYIAYVNFYNLKSVQDNCTGFLVRSDIVMTSAHCNGSKINVTLGAHYIKRKENTQVVIPVAKAIRHENYNSKLLLNDIMLLKLKSEVQITRAVNIIDLPSRHDWVRPWQVCSVAGWGLLTNGKYSHTLQEVDLQVQNAQTCKAIFSNFSNAKQLCVGDPKDKKVPSQGDAGAPLVCRNVAQGIVNYGHFAKPPAIFTRISSYVPWIVGKIKLLEHL
ncbi:mast cell protease 8-like [Dipodomys merriami]|uniref:mast cell protease 8-like n=1 Tax=Dipodomys merriami TaxID=94247 RepID=UPI00384FF9E5